MKKPKDLNEHPTYVWDHWMWQMGLEYQLHGHLYHAHFLAYWSKKAKKVTK